MAETLDKKDEEKSEFTDKGEASGFISLDRARLLAIETARGAPGEHGPGLAGTSMAFEVAQSSETEDYYVDTLSFRPQGDFGGALQKYRAAAELMWTANSIRELANLEMKLGHPQKAVDLLEKLIKRLGADTTSLELLGNAWFRLAVRPAK